MKRSLFGLIILFIFLTTYTPKFDFTIGSNFSIQKIEIEGNSILDSDEIIQKLNFLYRENLFFLNLKDIEKNLKNETFIESFSLKKIYLNTLKIIIVEKEPIAVLQNKKKKFYISTKGDLIDFQYIERYMDLPTVFGNGKFFYTLYQDLQNIQFPLKSIKSFYFFESGRWDLVMYDDKIIKLPIKDYLVSLKNYMESKNNSNFDSYKIFDYRIKDQLILN
ncbi:FtsQ-type POTRA domain-containing protein [Pelagibacterales bacterium SAG-MED29]|nr:FtsQ-type POTRA domain-containing protein [Pelagibacterales bacterium SAG-MED29]